MKRFRRTFALLMALVMLCGLAPIGVPVHAADTVSFTMEGYYDYAQSTELSGMIMDTRQEASLFSMKADGELNDCAMLRAAEIYACATTNRPDGSAWREVLEAPFNTKETVQFYTFAETASDAYANLFNGVPLNDSKYKSIGVGCFSQKGSDTKAWVVFAATAEAETPHANKGTPSVEVEIDIKPSNLNGVLQHHYFSNIHCACYLIKGTTIGTALELRNIGNNNVIIVPSEIDYAYTTTNPSVITFDNKAHTITAKSVGKAELGITVDGQPINFISTQAVVEVFDTPVLSYEKTDDMISVYYGDFPVSSMNDIVLYYGGTKDELWTKCNLELDNTFEHYHPDPTETYTYVVRYWDRWLDGWVNIGEPLVVQLGDTPTVTPTPTPTPTPPPDDGFRLPTESDLPDRTSEPTVAEASADLDRILTEFYPAGMDWPYETAYSWHGGTDITKGTGDAAFAMAVSDLVFGKLPAQLASNMTAGDLRPGDIVVTTNNDWYVILEATPLYILAASTIKLNSLGLQEDVVKSLLYPHSYMDSRINYVLSRYASDAPGADVLHPSIVPANAEILDSCEDSSYVNYVYSSVTRWTMTADGTLYLEGCGSLGYGDDSWSVYKDQIKKVVFGSGITGVRQDTFSGYKALEEVVFSDTVTEIYRSTFTNCTSLKSIVFGKGLTTIDENAFQYSGLESLTLPNTVTTLGSYAFSGCTSMKTLYVPASVTQWGNNVFTSCDALEELTLEDGLTSIGYSAFNHLDSLKTVNIPGSIKTVPKMAFYFSDIETLNLAEGVEVIDEEAFAYCKELKEIHIPNTVNTVADDAFRDCDSVTDVYFYGTEAQWAQIDIGSSNECLSGYPWLPANIHFVDPEQCRHTNVTVSSAIAPTCEQGGLTEGTVCSDCGQPLTEQLPIPALGHQYERTAYTAPTCAEPGSAEYVCANDPAHSYTEEIASTDSHSYKDGKCTVCGEAEPAVPHNPFNDVSDSDYFYAPVLWAVGKNVTGGLGDGIFGPNEGCTRGQVVTFLWAAAGRPEPQSTANPFTDVSASDYFFKPVLWAVEQGITGGLGDGLFGPHATCTRGQIVTFLWASQGKPNLSGTSSFEDVDDSDWYAKPVIWAAENQVTGGIAPGQFGPNNTCTRGQVVTFLYKVYG